MCRYVCPILGLLVCKDWRRWWLSEDLCALVTASVGDLFGDADDISSDDDAHRTKDEFEEDDEDLHDEVCY